MHRLLCCFVLAAACGGGTSSPVTPPPPTTPPAAPTALQAHGGIASAILTWNASDTATGYTVQRAANAGGPYTQIATVSATSYTDSGLAAGTTFYYVVQATNAAGASGNSSEVNALTAPAVPGGFAAVATNVTIALTWTAAPTATGYTLSRATAANGPFTQLATPTGTTYSDASLSPGTTYFYKLRALNASGPGAEATASDSTIPLAPALSVAATGTTMALTFATSPGTSYAITQSTTSGGPYTVIASALTTGSYTDSGLAAGTTYYYQVTAANHAGSVNSNIGSDTTAPGSPSNFTVGGGQASIGLGWAQVPAAADYEVFRAEASAGPYTSITVQTSTAFQDTNAVAGHSYYYQLRARNHAGSGAPATGGPASIAPPASTLTATGGQGVVNLQWTSVSTATNYLVTRGPHGAATSTTVYSGNNLSTVDTGLGDATTYYYVVVAQNQSGQTISAEHSALTTPAAPNPLSASGADGAVQLSWPASTGATAYTVLQSAAPQGPFSAVGSPVTGTTTTISGLPNGTAVCFEVAARDASGDGVPSSPACATPAAIPAAPVLNGTAGDSSVTLTWQSVSGATSYTVKTAAGSYPTTGTTYTVNGLSNGSSYSFTVSASNSYGSSPDSNTVTLTPLAAPVLQARARSMEVDLTWADVPYATNYDVYQGTSPGTETLLVSTSTPGYKDYGVVDGTTYYYYVRARVGSASGPASNEVKITPIREICLAGDAPYIYALDADNPARQPVRRIFGGQTMLDQPGAVRVDPATSQVFAVNLGSHVITAHPLSARGDAAPDEIVDLSSISNYTVSDFIIGPVTGDLYVSSGHRFSKSNGTWQLDPGRVTTGGPALASDGASYVFVVGGRSQGIFMYQDAVVSTLVTTVYPYDTANTLVAAPNTIGLANGHLAISVYDGMKNATTLYLYAADPVNWSKNSKVGINPTASTTIAGRVTSLNVAGNSVYTAVATSTSTTPDTLYAFDASFPAAFANASKQYSTPGASRIGGLDIDSAGNLWFGNAGTDVRASALGIMPTSASSWDGTKIGIDPAATQPSDIASNPADDTLWVANGGPSQPAGYAYAMADSAYTTSYVRQIGGNAGNLFTAVASATGDVFFANPYSTSILIVSSGTGGYSSGGSQSAFGPMAVSYTTLFSSNGQDTVYEYNRTGAAAYAYADSFSFTNNHGAITSLFADEMGILALTADGTVYEFANSASGPGVAPVNQLRYPGTLNRAQGLLRDSDGRVYIGIQQGTFRSPATPATIAVFDSSSSTAALNRTLSGIGIGQAVNGIAFCSYLSR